MSPAQELAAVTTQADNHCMASKAVTVTAGTMAKMATEASAKRTADNGYG